MTPHAKITQLTYAGQHITRAIEATEAADEPTGDLLRVKKENAHRIKELTDRLPKSSGVRQAGQLHGPLTPKGDA